MAQQGHRIISWRHLIGDRRLICIVKLVGCAVGSGNGASLYNREECHPSRRTERFGIGIAIACKQLDAFIVIEDVEGRCTFLMREMRVKVLSEHIA